ncbi:2-isopropylmalate synthase [Niabella ginsenosidivorans]|uniref:2-isopropylmalate synthase n=1 Tax=Niabella ginsenosidivorans TaxID=1176587 RepID=A0A1A9I3T2_9BACT|nr:alpha-isopropylmalate synthase regulatory domain-containing protein [Niabella ginsenosidivorans]ANH81975.1 2-isopropylmalate synthase [Niabella ginsenosidivorans]
MKQRYIEIMDTTLRDGEQTSGVSFSASEKLTIAQLLLTEVKADRIEIASARVSEGEFQAVKRITGWGSQNGHLQKIEVLTFVDGDTSINWVEKAGARVMNILTKGSLNHLTHQLKKTPDQHFKDIAAVIKKAQKKDIDCNVYLEDWSNGMRHSKEYVFQYIDFLSRQPVKRIMLPDTLGVLTPSESYTFLSEITQKYPQLHFDFHGHNDYDLGVANALEAVKAGISGLHLTINGMGERAGNTPLASIIAVLNDFQKDVKTSVNEKALYKISKLVEAFSGFRVSPNKPIVGENVFTQTAGIHADGDKKKNLYYNDLMPERFGRKRKYALGKTSGKANIENNLAQLGIQLGNEDLKKVTQRIIELGDKKETVTQDDLPFIISDVLDSNTTHEKVLVENYVLTHSKNMRPSTTIRIKFEDGVVEENAQGDGQYDAFMNALRKIYAQKKLPLAKLVDYIVRIPPGGKSDALCETIITWNFDGREFSTTGLDSDQTVAAIKATQKMLNLI